MASEPSVENILSAWDQADWFDHWFGPRWYPETHAFARTLCDDIDKAAGVIAALSPRETWTRNKRSAQRLFATGETVGLSRNVFWAKRIMRGEPVLDVLHGPKTRAFYRCILSAGECDDVCVDMHAWNIAVGSLDAGAQLGRRGAYERASAAYVAAARVLDEQPSAVQATTWLWQRREVHGRV